MKKIIYIFTALCFAVLSVSACRIDQNPGLSRGLTISVYSDDPVTRAGDTDFENNVEHFDYFFFLDAEGNTPVAGMHGRVSGTSVTLDTQPTGDFAALRSITSYVYVLANYPSEIDHSADMTLAEILALPVDGKIVKSKKTEINPITNEVEETGEVEFCNSIVMDSWNDGVYTTRLTPVEFEEERIVNIALTRIAAKLTLKVSVPASAAGTIAGETWTPVWDDLRVYYVNALNNLSTVGATPVRRSAIAPADIDRYEYLSYPVRYPVTKLSGEGDVTHVYMTAPVYTYPQVWESDDNGEPYFKIQLPWVSDVRGSSNFYYKVIVPKPAGSTAWTLDRNTYYDASVNLTVLDTDNEYVVVTAGYTVATWSECPFEGAVLPTAAKFFDVPRKSFEIFSQEELLIPFQSSSAVSAYFTEIDYTHYRQYSGIHYSFNYTESDNVTSVTLPTTHAGTTIPAYARDLFPYSLTVVGNSVKFTHELTNLFTARNITLVIKNVEGASETVTIKQHPAIEVRSLATDNVFVNGHFARATEGVHVNGSTQKIGVPYVLKYSQEAGQTRYHSDDARFPGAGSSYNDQNAYWYNPGSSYSGSESNCPQIISNISRGRYGWIEGDPNRDVPYMIEITVSAFNEDNSTYTIIDNGVPQAPKGYIVGDPRVRGGSRFSDLAKYMYKPSTLRNDDGTTTTGDAEFRDWEEPTKIKIASTSLANGATIAPRFIISSFYNAMPNSLTFENALKRAATYQEAGYPAGRWRLPTESEIMFIVSRQQENIIPPVFGATSTYWCADGRRVTLLSSGGVKFDTPSSSSVVAVNRFIYDTWYWGDEPMDPETYWPNQHEH